MHVLLSLMWFTREKPIYLLLSPEENLLVPNKSLFNSQSEFPLELIPSQCRVLPIVKKHPACFDKRIQHASVVNCVEAIGCHVLLRSEHTARCTLSRYLCSVIEITHSSMILRYRHRNNGFYYYIQTAAISSRKNL